MKNIKNRLFITVVSIGSFLTTNAQELPSKEPKALISFGAGMVFPSSNAKDISNLVNSSAISADVFVALIRKGWDGSVKGHGIKKGWDGSVRGHKLAIGLNISGIYVFGGSGNPTTPTPNSVPVYDGTSSVTIIGTDPRNPGFRTGLGPQFMFTFGKFVVSSILLGEYFSMTQKAQSVVQTTLYNGQTYNFDLIKRMETNTSGFALTPKVKIQYMLSSRFGFYADASYTLGPKSQTEITTLVPMGTQLQDGTYEVQSLEMSTRIVSTSKSTALNAFGTSIGVIIGLGKTSTTGDIKKGWNGKQ